MVPENKIRISENIFFDNNTKRYVYYDKLPLTKSNIEIDTLYKIINEYKNTDIIFVSDDIEWCKKYFSK